MPFESPPFQPSHGLWHWEQHKIAESNWADPFSLVWHFSNPHHTPLGHFQSSISFTKVKILYFFLTKKCNFIQNESGIDNTAHEAV